MKIPFRVFVYAAIPLSILISRVGLARPGFHKEATKFKIQGEEIYSAAIKYIRKEEKCLWDFESLVPDYLSELPPSEFYVYTGTNCGGIEFRYTPFLSSEITCHMPYKTAEWECNKGWR